MEEITIKGTKYKIKFVNKAFEFNNTLADATCDAVNKVITINKNCRDLKQVIRHELVHAYFNECNLPCYSTDETLVDWIAYIIPDIEKSLKEFKEIIND